MSWELPSKGQNSLLILWESFSMPRGISLWQFVRGILTRFPQWVLGPFEYFYWKSVISFGKRTWYAPHNLYRQMYHFGGGLGIGVVSPIVLGMATAVIVCFLSTCNELQDAAEEGEWNFKNTIDVLVWTSGAAVGVLIGSQL